MAERGRGRPDRPEQRDAVHLLTTGAVDSDPDGHGGEPTEVLAAPRPRTRRTNVALAVAAAALAGAVGLGALDHAGDAGTPGARSGAPPTRTAAAAPDVSLTRLRRYQVVDVAVRGTGQVLHVAYRPTPTLSFEGGTVTLYAPGEFGARAFLRSARRITVDGHAAYFGSYRYRSTLAWPVPGDRWVCLSGFIGTGNGTDPAVTRAQEMAVARGVVVR